MFNSELFKGLSPEWSARLHYYQELQSTNDTAHELVHLGFGDHKHIVLADNQLSGRGRRGTSWISPPTKNLLFSMILWPTFAMKNWHRLSLACGLGLVKGLRRNWQVQAMIKWPNDIFIREKKCAGILVETRQDYAVLGIGINVHSFPQAFPSTSLSEELNKDISREKLLATLLDSIAHETDICGDANFKDQLREIRSMCLLKGREVSFLSSGEKYSGTVKSIGERGELVIQFNNGQTRAFLQAEEIREHES